MKTIALFIILALLTLTGCLILDETDSSIEATIAPLHPPVNKVEEPTMTTTITEAVRPSSSTAETISGPTLLIQTDYHTFQYLEINTRSFYPFPLPEQGIGGNLSPHISPSGHYLRTNFQDGAFGLIDLSTGQTNAVHHLPDSPVYFDPHLAAQEALAYFTEEPNTILPLADAVLAAYSESIQTVQWYQSDRFWLFVLGKENTSTNLHLFDLKKGEARQLETLPGLVKGFWVGPSGEDVLIKKSFVFEPGIWQDDRYYTLNLISQETKPVTLPNDSQNPTVFWLTHELIGIIHQSQTVGGIGFSVVNILTGEQQALIQDAFTTIRYFDDRLLIIQHHHEEQTTQITLMSFTIDDHLTRTMEGFCFFFRFHNNLIILNCEDEGILLDNDLHLRVLTDPIFILAQAPDHKINVLVTRTGQTYLSDPTITSKTPILSGTHPLEIRWLPDSSGFLYRADGQLWLYDLQNKESHFLLTSPLFDDYTNINAVWVKSE